MSLRDAVPVASSWWTGGDGVTTIYIWYKDWNRTIVWNFDNDRVFCDMFLYRTYQ